ncbi:MAG TPA: sugar ABC transporter ATP-binding protein, partial [Ktedonobacteraceae bacterium]
MKLSLVAQYITKRYSAVTALADGNLETQSGEVMALMEANGSGKSTLGKIITGVTAPDQGQLLLDGKPINFSSPQAARKRGIVAVYQELSLIPDMTVAENIWLTHEPRRWQSILNGREMRRRTQDLLKLFEGTIGLMLQPDSVVATLAPDERQIVEILKALSFDPRIIILDEATASLDSRQVDRLFGLVAQWKTQGRIVIFTSHRMEEIFRVADRVTVLRNGKTVGTAQLDQISQEELVAMMIENSVSSQTLTHRTEHESSPIRLSAEQIRTNILQSVDIKVHAGEILGIGGLQGQGQSDLLLTLFGAIAYKGAIQLEGMQMHFSHPSQAMSAGIAFVPGDRGAQGLLSIRSIFENLQLPSWAKYGLPLQMKHARQDASQVASRLNLVMGSLDAPVDSLSGGNAQKVVLGKWLLREPKVLLLDDPTKEVDVGAKGEFYRLLADLREAGTAIVLYSSDDEELLGLSDRILVLRDGK